MSSLQPFKDFGSWTCLICNNSQDLFTEHMTESEGKEALLCKRCGSSWRDRCLVLQVLKSCGLPGDYLHSFKLDYSKPILGIGDSYRVQSALASRLSYVNTFIDKFPRLNIEELSEDYGRIEVVTCS
jgi:hypothetical protein